MAPTGNRGPQSGNRTRGAGGSSGFSSWQKLAIGMSFVIIPWIVYVNFHPQFDKLRNGGGSGAQDGSAAVSITGAEAAHLLGQIPGLKNLMALTSTHVDPEMSPLSGEFKTSLQLHGQQQQQKHLDHASGDDNNATAKMLRTADMITKFHTLNSGSKSTLTTVTGADGRNRPNLSGTAGKDRGKGSEKEKEKNNEKNGEKKESSKNNNNKKNKNKGPKPDLTGYIEGSPVYGNNIFQAKFGSDGGVVLEDQLPLLGPVPTNGAEPLWGVKHKGTDAIFALACNYPKLYYQRFVGSLRKSGFEGDIVLAVSPVPKMKPGVEAYVRNTGVVAYGFDVDCLGKDNCKLQDEFLGYPDPRPHRTFANIRYALYEYWLRKGGYTAQSYILILDFRDTFFQKDPFLPFGPLAQRPKGNYDLQLFSENYEVKNIGICVYNSLWIGRCFGKSALKNLKHQAVICSGSTLGNFNAIYFYVRTMLGSMDTVKCWLKGIESDQGYQNYLFYNGHFNPAHFGMKGNATLFYQGSGVVNTIGAMNGFRVPKEKKGPLKEFWKSRDEEGWIINYDGERSAVVHQWDRWYKELHKFIDTNTFDRKTRRQLWTTTTPSLSTSSSFSSSSPSSSVLSTSFSTAANTSYYQL